MLQLSNLVNPVSKSWLRPCIKSQTFLPFAKFILFQAVSLIRAGGSKSGVLMFSRWLIVAPQDQQDAILRIVGDEIFDVAVISKSLPNKTPTRIIKVHVIQLRPMVHIDFILSQ